MQIVADAPPLAFGNLQHLAFEPHLLRFTLAQFFRHCGKRCGEFAHFIAAPRHGWRVRVSLAKGAHAAREPREPRDQTKMQHRPQREAEQRHRGGHPAELRARIGLRGGNGFRAIERE